MVPPQALGEAPPPQLQAQIQELSKQNMALQNIVTELTKKIAEDAIRIKSHAEQKDIDVMDAETRRMSDAQFIPGLIKLASNVAWLDNAEAIAGRELLAFDGEKYPSDGCAITQSTMLRLAGASDLPFTFQALAYVNLLLKRGWQKVAVGDQKAGDVGTTVFGAIPHHGIDHVYLVLQVLNPSENLIADNQARAPHFRFTDGRDGRSPTTMFLRAA